jgi:S-methylmethionine-dependent homocysteine/selenocysteine methylase
MSTLVRLDSSALEEVEARAEASGVELDLSIASDGSLWIGWICRDRSPKGSGWKVLQDVAELADDCGVAIRLVVCRSLDALVAHYEEFGFREIQDPARTPNDDFLLMEREAE